MAHSDIESNHYLVILLLFLIIDHSNESSSPDRYEYRVPHVFSSEPLVLSVRASEVRATVSRNIYHFFFS